jgi:5-methylcytosine-specific restriction endonuclease McrA
MASKYTEEERKQRALEASQRYRERNREKERARRAAYCAANPDKVKAYQKSDVAKAARAKSVAKNADHYKQWRAQWEVENRERRNAQRREAYQANPERGRARSMRYLAKPESRALVAARVRASKQRPEVRERIKLNKQNRRKRAAGGKLSRGITAKLMVLQRACCAGCRGSLAELGHELDHIEPLARGGAHADDNMQLLCPPCNRFKNAKDPIAWAQSQGRLL